MQSQSSVIIKGVREGLLFILGDDVPFPQLLTELSERMNARPDFFRGAGVTINAGRRVIDRPEFDVVYGLFTRHGMSVIAFVSLSAQSRMVAEGYGVPSRPPSFAVGDAGGSVPSLRGLKGRGAVGNAAHDPSDSVAEAGAGVFLRCNLRPGQSVRYPGDVCVLGDVEAGAEVVADGDIIVWGALLGTAQAGASGDDEAVVCALRLSPQQLGIAGYLSRFPPDDQARRAGMETRPYSGPQPPELARVEAGRIVLEAWGGD